MIQSSRKFLLATLVTTLVTAAPFLVASNPAQAQTQVVSQNGVIYQSPTRPQVFKESHATSGQSSQRWGNDRDTDRDRRNGRDYREGGRRDHYDRNDSIPSACAPGSNTVFVPVYPNYPGYAPYPTYPYGSSVTVSTPGYNDGTFNVFPWSTTVTTFGSAPVHNYHGYHNYPAYPTYVPGPGTYGYRGAATPGYIYNGGSFPSGAFITGSANAYGAGLSAGYSNGRTSITIGTHR